MSWRSLGCMDSCVRYARETVYNVLVNKAALGEEFRDWRLSSLETRLYASTRTRLLAVGTTSSRTSVAGALSSSDAFLLE